MGDKIVRQLLKTSDGKPSTGKNVKLRPATAAGAGSDINLPETPAVSGIYRSAAEVPHGVYKEVINDVETGETITIEPGRACYAIASDKTKTALIDKMLTDVVRLSAFSADTDADANSSDLYDAIIHAATYKKTLILTNDVTLSSPVALGGKNLYIDLNGKTLTFTAGITGGNKVFISNGSVALLAGSQSVSASVGTAWQDVEFTVNGASQVVANVDDRYINVRGMPATVPGTASTCPVVIGCQGVATADKLLLGATKLGYLQNFVDTLYANLLAVHNWLTALKRSQLDAMYSWYSGMPDLPGMYSWYSGMTANFRAALGGSYLRQDSLAGAHRIKANSNGYLQIADPEDFDGSIVVLNGGTVVPDRLSRKRIVCDNSAPGYVFNIDAKQTTGPDILCVMFSGIHKDCVVTAFGGLSLNMLNSGSVPMRNLCIPLYWCSDTSKWTTSHYMSGT